MALDSMPSLRDAKSVNRYIVEMIGTEEGLDGLENDWNRLSTCSESPNVFMTYSWFRAWLRRLIADEGRERLQPHVLAIRRDGAIVGIAPLVRRRVSNFGFVIWKLEFLTFHADYNDLVLGDDEVGQTLALAEFLTRSTKDWELVDLRNLRGLGEATAHIKSALTVGGCPWLFLPEEVRCPYMSIDGPRSGIVNQYSRSMRRAYYRFERKTKEGLRTRIVENPQNEPGLLDRLVALEVRKHVGGQRSGPFLGTYPEVFEKLFENLGPQGQLLVVLLEWNDRFVACDLLYRCGKQIWGYFTAYDPEFSDLSPGIILKHAVIDYCLAHGFDEFDFLSGEDPYKMRWTSKFHERYRLQIWNRGWMSRIHAFAYFRLRVGRRKERLSARDLQAGRTDTG